MAAQVFSTRQNPVGPAAIEPTTILGAADTIGTIELVCVVIAIDGTWMVSAAFCLAGFLAPTCRSRHHQRALSWPSGGR